MLAASCCCCSLLQWESFLKLWVGCTAWLSTATARTAQELDCTPDWPHCTLYTILKGVVNLMASLRWSHFGQRHARIHSILAVHLLLLSVLGPSTASTGTAVIAATCLSLSHSDFNIGVTSGVQPYRQLHCCDVICVVSAGPKGLQQYIDTVRQGKGQNPKQYSARYICSLVGDFHRTLLYGGELRHSYPACGHRAGHFHIIGGTLSFGVLQCIGQQTWQPVTCAVSKQLQAALNSVMTGKSKNAGGCNTYVVRGTWCLEVFG